MKKVIIIGGGAAGPKAAAKLSRLNKDIDIHLYTDLDVVSYSACGLPFYIEGLISDIKSLIIRTPEEFEKQGVKIHLNAKCTKINPNDKTVEIFNILTNEHILVSYDVLVIATGARPFIPPINNVDLNNIFTLKTLNDGIKIREKMQKSKKAVIIGGGNISIELLWAFAKNNIEVNVIEKSPHMLNMLDPEMGELVENYILGNFGNIIKIHTNKEASEFIGDNNKNVIAVKLKEGEVIDTDFVVIASGIVPNSEIFKEAGGILSVRDTIKVDTYMQTNLKDVYACGDVVANYNIVSHKPGWIPLASTANKEGRIVALNINGMKESFHGVLSSVVTKFHNLTIASCGLSETYAAQNGFTPISAMVTKKDKAGYMPDAQEITLKLVVDYYSQKLLGAQAIGPGDVHKRIETVVACIMSDFRVNELLHLDLPYAPPYSPTIAPLLTVAQIISQKIYNAFKQN